MGAFPIRYEHLFRHESGVRSTYMKRLTIGRLNLHLFYRGDGDEAPHDHPWSFWSFPLADYLEEVYDPLADRHYVQVGRRFAWHYRPARHAHRVLGRASWIESVGYVVAPGKWATIVWKTPKQREWGFWTKEGWRHWKAYFAAGKMQLVAIG